MSGEYLLRHRRKEFLVPTLLPCPSGICRETADCEPRPDSCSIARHVPFRNLLLLNNSDAAHPDLSWVIVAHVRDFAVTGLLDRS